MRAAAARSSRQQADEAVRELVAELRGLAGAELAIVFATSEYAEELRAIAQQLRRELGIRHVLGASTTGVIDARGEHEEERGIGALALADVRAEVELASSADEVRTGLAKARFALALPDPRRLEARLLEEIARAPATVAGGGISGTGQELFALADATSGEGGCALASIEGCRAQVVVAQGAEPATPFLRVTRARRNALLELDGQPAGERLAAHVNAAPGGTDQLANLLFVALRQPGSSTHEIRPIINVDAQAGALLLPEDVPGGVEVAFAMRETLGARSALQAALREVASQGPVRAALYFNCAGRGQALHLEPDADLELIRRALPDVPLLGMTSSFELARVGGLNRMLMYSGVLVAFRD